MKLKLLNMVLNNCDDTIPLENIYAVYAFLNLVQEKNDMNHNLDPNLMNICQMFESNPNRKLLEWNKKYTRRLDGIVCYNYAMVEGCMKHLASDIRFNTAEGHNMRVNIERSNNYYEGPLTVPVNSKLCEYLFILAFAKKERQHPKYKDHGLEQGLDYMQAYNICYGENKSEESEGTLGKFFYLNEVGKPICQHEWIYQTFMQHNELLTQDINQAFGKALETYNAMPEELVKHPNAFALLCYTLYGEEKKDFVKFHNTVVHDGSLWGKDKTSYDVRRDCRNATKALVDCVSSLIVQNWKFRKPNALKMRLLKIYTRFYFRIKNYDFLFWSTVIASFLLLTMAYCSRT